MSDIGFLKKKSVFHLKRSEILTQCRKVFCKICHILSVFVIKFLLLSFLLYAEKVTDSLTLSAKLQYNKCSLNNVATIRVINVQ